MSESKTKFDLGEIKITFFAKLALERTGEKSAKFLNLHKNCNWGEVTDNEKTQNNLIVKDGTKGKVLSAYVTSMHEIIWVTTDLPKGETTVLLPREYDLEFDK